VDVGRPTWNFNLTGLNRVDYSFTDAVREMTADWTGKLRFRTRVSLRGESAFDVVGEAERLLRSQLSFSLMLTTGLDSNNPPHGI
jgi:hypothetical protein